MLPIALLMFFKTFSPLEPRSKNKMDTIRNERWRVINISWDNLLRNRPLKKKSLNQHISVTSEIQKKTARQCHK